MIIPSLLKPGDTIGIAAPGRKILPGEIEAAMRIFKDWGLNVTLAKNLFSTSHGYMAGSDEERLKDMQTFLDDPSIKAVVCARGGYGSTRIIDLLDYSSLQKNPKWLIGFSDVTAFHLKLSSLRLASIHGTMPILFSKNDSASSILSLFELLMEGAGTVSFKPSGFLREGKASGELIGGNLSLLCESLGTSSEPDTENKILIVEEIDEHLYKLDRMFTQLRRAGKLKNLAALVVGHLTDMKPGELPFGETAEEIISKTVHDYSYPLVFGFPSGHENPNLAWVHGAPAVLTVDKGTSSIQYPEGIFNKGI